MVAPTRRRRTNNNKISSDMRSVPDPIINKEVLE